MSAVPAFTGLSVAEALATDGIGATFEPRECPECHHAEFLHETLLTSIGTFDVCHELTDDGECFRVRHSQGIPFGACRRDLG